MVAIYVRIRESRPVTFFQVRLEDEGGGGGGAGGGGGGGGGEKNVCVRERLRASALSFLDGDIHPRC